jgi:flagellar hook assembly protein FlgD
VEDRDFVSLSPGEQVELAFIFPGDPAPGTVRDFVVKSVGYYIQLPKGQVSSHPTACELYENYPNPFNMETIISYALSREANVELVIYNVLGEKVRTLVDEHQAAGMKKVSWDGKDDRGSEVSSGYYFYRLRADEEAITKKMLLLK